MDIVATEVGARAQASRTRGILRRTVDVRLKRSPYGMVACALGVGFVLGGGLFTKLSGRLVALGLRVALRSALPFLERQIIRIVPGSRQNNNERKI